MIIEARSPSDVVQGRGDRPALAAAAALSLAGAMTALVIPARRRVRQEAVLAVATRVGA